MHLLWKQLECGGYNRDRLDKIKLRVISERHKLLYSRDKVRDTLLPTSSGENPVTIGLWTQLSYEVDEIVQELRPVSDSLYTVEHSGDSNITVTKMYTRSWYALLNINYFFWKGI